MKFFDWVKNLKGKKGAGGKELPLGLPSAETDARIPGRRRIVAFDPRFLPKPPKKNYWDKSPPVLTSREARRAYSPSMRTRNPALRTIASDGELLSERGLPRWASEAEVATALGITEGKLRWFANHRLDDRVTHYYRFRVPKRSGGYRTIMAPKTGLKAVQRQLLWQMISKLPISEWAHGFVPCRSVRTNASPHVGRRVVMRFDLEDFFGTVTFGRVRGFLVAMGYNFEVATSLALLMTEADRQPVEVDGALRYVPIGERYCVQGAPTSPAICNALVMRLDRRMAGFAAAQGFTYTRYADDLTFSGDDDTKVGLFLRVVAQIVKDEGFRLNKRKTRVMRSGQCQKVTGVVVNEVLGLSRKDRRKLRAKIHQMSSASPIAEIDRVRGQVRYLEMLNRAQARALWKGWMYEG